MLVISLRQGETVHVGEDVEFCVTGITIAGMRLLGGQVKIGIAAPPEVGIHRGPSRPQRKEAQTP